MIIEKGLEKQEKLNGTFRNIYTPADIKTMVLMITARAKSIRKFLDRKSALNFLTTRIEGKIYIETEARDTDIYGHIFYNIKNNTIDYYVNYQNNAGDFFYIKAQKTLSLIGFSNSLQLLSGSVYKKQNHEKIADIMLQSESKSVLTALKEIKFV